MAEGLAILARARRGKTRVTHSGIKMNKICAIPLLGNLDKFHRYYFEVQIKGEYSSVELAIIDQK